MSLNEASLWNIVQKQYRFKLLSNKGILSSLMATQLFALLFSLGGSGSSGSSGDFYSVSVQYYNGNLIFLFTMIWALASSIQITTKAYRYEDYIFVTNRLSSNIANVLYLVTISFIAGAFIMMASMLLKVGIIVLNGPDQVFGVDVDFVDFLLGILIAGLYALILSAVGYLIGTLTQIHKVFAIIIPLLFVGMLYQNEGSLFIHILEFYTQVASAPEFLIRVVLTSLVLFVVSIVISNRLEVRK